ncbi:hypothetical protein TURU_102525 [Turdus rufiventris]|nr:hypothetical protein TURU_102525 [Turdus rufiventris]
MLKGGCDSMGGLCWSRLMAGIWAHGETSQCWSTFASKTCDPTGDPFWGSLCLEDYTPLEGLMVEKFLECCLPWEGTHAGAGEEDLLMGDQQHHIK